MACLFEVFLPAKGRPAIEAATAALDEVDRLEAQLTVYDDASEVSRMNATAWQRPVRVRRNLFELLQCAEKLTEQTGGAYDITAGALIKCWGFFRGPRRVPSSEEIEAALQCVGMHHVTLDAEHRTVHYDRPGLEINLGSIGKGFALDRAAEVLRGRCGRRNALLHGGSSSVYAVGDSPAEGKGGGWLVGVADVLRPSEQLATVRLRNKGLGTSCTTQQYFEADGKTWGHILDPRGGWPASGVLSASVVADSSAVADALATAFYILGPEQAEAFCSQHQGISAMIVVRSEENARPQRIIVGKDQGMFDLRPRPVRRREAFLERSEVLN